VVVTPADLRRTLMERSRARRLAAEDRARCVARAAKDGVAELVRRGLVHQAWLIGSAAWGGFGVRSDADVVVRGLPAPARSRAEALMAETVGTHVDVLRWEDLPDGFRERVAREGVRLA
jgi:predicted nucleotidyltransferase